MTIIQTSILIDKDCALNRLSGLLAVAFIIWQDNSNSKHRIAGNKAMRLDQKTIERGAFYPNSKQGGRAPVPEPRWPPMILMLT